MGKHQDNLITLNSNGLFPGDYLARPGSIYGQAEPYPYPGHPNTKNGTRAFHIHNDLHGTYLILKKVQLTLAG